ncbi:hypothetical protein D4764_0143000, partial [Takifugu flavidus]
SSSLCKGNFLSICYKDLTSCCQLQQKKRSSHQISFNPNHVLCSSAAAVGSWILNYIKTISIFIFLKELQGATRAAPKSRMRLQSRGLPTPGLDSSSNTVTLNGVNVQPEDTAVYYCARDTITQTISAAEQKPSEHQHIFTRGSAVTPGINHDNNVEEKC